MPMAIVHKLCSLQVAAWDVCRKFVEAAREPAPKPLQHQSGQNLCHIQILVESCRAIYQALASDCAGSPINLSEGFKAFDNQAYNVFLYYRSLLHCLHYMLRMRRSSSKAIASYQRLNKQWKKAMLHLQTYRHPYTPVVQPQM